MKKVIGIIIGLLGILSTILGIVLKVKESAAISIIGSADGPTSIFVAGRLGGDFSIAAIGVGVILIFIGSVCFFYKRK